MKIKSYISALGLMMLSASYVNAQTIDISTGTSGGAQQPLAVADSKWTVTVPGGGVATPFTANGTLVLNNTAFVGDYALATCGRWISPNTILNGGFIGDMNIGSTGVFVYKMKFVYNPTCPVATAVINLNDIGGDDNVGSISVNNSVVMNFAGVSFKPFHSFTINVPASDIVSGNNEIEVTVNNNSNFTGLFICGNITITQVPSTLTPSITSSLTTFCTGQALSFTGAVTGGTPTNTYWEIAQSNSTGTPIAGGYSWSQWSTTPPGAFTFPSSVNPPCGQYYRIKVAVTNACVVWAEATEVVYISCSAPPTPSIGGADTVCAGSTVTLCSNYLPSSTYTDTWSPRTKNIGFMNCITMTPASPYTTYTLTVTDNVTGCIGSTTHTVYTAPDNATFSTTMYPTSSTYCTITAQPALGNSGYQGFGDMWYIQELDANLNVVWTFNGNPNCWWTYPGVEYFQGFNGPAQSQSCSSSGTGMFKASTYYRIVHGVWNHYCSWTQASIIVYYTPATHAMQAKYTELKDDAAPDFGDPTYINQITNAVKNTVKVYPNPSKDVFNLSLSNTGSGTIEVYDMMGRTIKTIELNVHDTEYKLDLSNMPKGLYLLNTVIDGNRSTQKLILQ